MKISKLYNYYLKNIFKKNWVRIAMVLSLSLVISIGIPYLNYWNVKNEYKGKLKLDVDEKGRKPILLEKKIDNFKDWNKLVYNDKDTKTFWESFLKYKDRKFKELKETTNKEKIKEKKEKIESLRNQEKVIGVSFLPSSLEETKNFSLSLEGKNKGIELWGTINNIAWWVFAFGFVFVYLTLSISEKLFYHPKYNGEEATVLILTPGVKRRDLVFSKWLAFVTYLIFLGFISFILPFSVYSTWCGTLASLSHYLMLFFYILLLAPIIFSLFFFFYIFITNSINWLATVLSYIWLLFPYVIWPLIKSLSPSILPYQLENWFFHPLYFTIGTVIIGLVFFYLYYRHYQQEDLG